MSLETQLRDALGARAESLPGPAFDPYERVAGAVVTSRRRRRVVAAGAVAAAAAIAMTVPGLVQGGHDSTLPAKRTQVVVPGPDDPRWSSLSSWPTRGALAADTAFTTAVRNQFASANVLYAADLPTSRVVVTWDPESGTDGKLTMLSGPRGAAATDLSEVSSASGGLEDVVSLREHADNDSMLVVLARPGVSEVGISRSVQIGRDGSVTRDAFRTVRLTDGLHTELLEDSPGSLTRVRLSDGPGARVTLTGRPSLDAADYGAICLGCTGEDFRAKAEEAMGGGVAAMLGLDPKDVQTSTVYFGPVDSAVATSLGMGDTHPRGSLTRLLVADTTLPGGQVMRSALIAVTAKDGTTGATMELSNGVPIAAGTAATRPFVLHGGGSETGNMSYEVFAPAAGSVRLVSSSPSIYPPTPTVPLVGRRARLTTPTWGGERPAYDVEAYDSSGNLLGRWPVDLPSEDEWTAGGAP